MERASDIQAVVFIARVPIVPCRGGFGLTQARIVGVRRVEPRGVGVAKRGVVHSGVVDRIDLAGVPLVDHRTPLAHLGREFTAVDGKGLR